MSRRSGHRFAEKDMRQRMNLAAPAAAHCGEAQAQVVRTGRMRSLIGLILGFALAMSGSVALAQSYPSRPLRLFVSFPPGGASDLIARVVGVPLSARLGQPIVVENRPGANGNIAGEAVARAEPDGYALLLGPSALFTINPHLYAKMAIDPLKELQPIASLTQNALVLA